MTLLRSTVEVEMFTRTQVTGTGIGSQTVNSGDEVTLSCQVSIIRSSLVYNFRITKECVDSFINEVIYTKFSVSDNS